MSTNNLNTPGSKPEGLASWPHICIPNFNIFVNSLPDFVKCKCVMYADDTTLLVSSSDPVTLQILT